MPKKYLRLIALFISLILIDQASKYLIRHFDGTFICNYGISFGIDLPSFLFWLVWLFIIVVLTYSIFKNFHSVISYFLTLLLAGAVANIIDRFYFGCVLDFIDLKIWPVFNLADIFITIGAIILIVFIMKNKK